MRTVKYRLNYGGYVGTDEVYEVDVPDDATSDEIDDLVDNDYQEKIKENCYWELLDEEE